MIFHRHFAPGCIDLVLAEPTDGHFLWLAISVGVRYRGTGLTKFVVDYCLSHHHGVHHIHAPDWLPTFHHLADLYRWMNAGPSPFFNNACCYVAASSPRREFDALLEVMLAPRQQSRCPPLKTFLNSVHRKRAMRIIRSRWEEYLDDCYELANLDSNRV